MRDDRPIVALLLVGLIAWRTRWRPLDLGDLRRSRAFGQLLRAPASSTGATGASSRRSAWRAIPIIGGFDLLTRLLTGDAGGGSTTRSGTPACTAPSVTSSAGSAGRSPRRSSPPS